MIMRLAALSILTIFLLVCSRASNHDLSLRGDGSEPEAMQEVNVVTARGSRGAPVHIYSADELRRAKQTYRMNLLGMWGDIKRDVPQQYSAYRARAASVDLHLPLRGAGFFGFEASAPGGYVRVPIDAVKLFDDLTVALAYREKHHCDTNGVVDYVGILATQAAAVWQPPLEAMKVPSNVLVNDSYVNRLSGNLLKSGIYFILAHELGHVVLGHHGNDPEKAQLSQREEGEADRFALMTMKNAGGRGVPPAGMALFFRLTRRLNLLNKAVTHPMSNERMRMIGLALEQEPGAWGESRSSVSRLGRYMVAMANELNDTDYQRLHVKRSVIRKLGTLASCSEWRPPASAVVAP